MGFNASYDDAGSRNPNFKRNARITGCAYVLLGFIIVVVVAFLAGPSRDLGGGQPGILPIQAPLTDDEAISMILGGDQQPRAGGPYRINVMVYNATDQPQKVSKITVSQSYLAESVQVQEVKPEFRGSRADQESMIYVVQQAVPSYDTAAFEVIFQADQPGTYTGTIGACFSSGFCAEAPLTTEVIP